MPAFAAGHGAARLKASLGRPEPPVRPARPASATVKSSQIHSAAVAASQILAIRKTTQPPAATLPPPNPHRPGKPHRRA